jgi:hypothetical protein
MAERNRGSKLRHPTVTLAYHLQTAHLHAIVGTTVIAQVTDVEPKTRDDRVTRSVILETYGSGPVR